VLAESRRRRRQDYGRVFRRDLDSAARLYIETVNSCSRITRLGLSARFLDYHGKAPSTRKAIRRRTMLLTVGGERDDIMRGVSAKTVAAHDLCKVKMRKISSASKCSPASRHYGCIFSGRGSGKGDDPM